MKKQIILSKAMSLLLLMALVLTLLITGVAILDSQRNRNFYIRETVKTSLIDSELSDRDNQIKLLKQEVEDLKQQIPE